MIKIYNEKLEKWFPSVDDGRHHAFLADPPYFLSFQQNGWDANKGADANIALAEGWGKRLLPYLYPGALGFMFSAPKTQHYTMLGMERAGFRIWDTCMFLFGTGFPKAQNIELMTGDSNWNGRKTCSFKPAYEPLIAFQAPTDGMTYAELAKTYGTATLNIDGGRIPLEDGIENSRQRQNSPNAGMNGLGGSGFKPNFSQPMYKEEGRFPANVVFDEDAAKFLDEQENGASRFFYTAKAGNKEREAGLESFVAKRVGDGRETINDTAYQRDATFRRNVHPTVKPIDLIKYFATLLLPPDCVKDRSILVPFSGSGSEIIGCHLAGWDNVIGIEQDKEYCDIAQARIDWWTKTSEYNGTTDVKEILSKASNPKEEETFSLF